MQIFAEASDAAKAATRFFNRNDDAIPEDVLNRLSPVMGAGSTLTQTVTFTETVYAAAKADADAIPTEGLEIAAGCADLIQRRGYHQNLAFNDTPEQPRARGISDALRRIAGEAGDFPAEADDPPVNPTYAPPASEGETE